MTPKDPLAVARSYKSQIKKEEGTTSRCEFKENQENHNAEVEKVEKCVEHGWVLSLQQGSSASGNFAQRALWSQPPV